MKRCPSCDTDKPDSEYYETVGGRTASYCKPCSRANSLRHYHKNRAKGISQSAEWRAKNRERWNYIYRRSWLKRAYGITPERYQELLEQQNGACDLCGKKTAKTLAVDHDHKTGAVRALLCHVCNTAMGTVEMPGWINKAKNYLEKHGAVEEAEELEEIREHTYVSMEEVE